MTVKIVLSEVIKRKQLSKRQLSKRMGIPYAQVFRFFRKGWNPTVRTLDRVAKAAGVKIADLIRD